MASVVVLGESARIQGYALAGARMVVAETADQVRDAWTVLGERQDVVVLTQLAAVALKAQLNRTDGPMPVVMPP